MILTRLVTCRFYGQLNRFLAPQRKHKTFVYAVKGTPAIKDTVEALGVPHVEVDCILINGQSVGFDYQIKGDERIRVYPQANHLRLKRIMRLKAKPPARPRFILDAHLGKLTRHLRLLGFDVLYRKDIADQQIVAATRRTGRVVLTRDIGILKNKTVRYGYFVRAIDPKKQLKEIIQRFNLSGRIKPFRVCLRCNGRIRRVAKDKVMHRLPPLTKEFYTRFYMCRSCRKVYWQGAHYESLAGIIRSYAKIV